MKSSLTTVITLLTLALASGGPALSAQTPSPDDWVKKSIQALGGEDAIRKNFHYKASGKVIIERMGRQVSGNLELALRDSKNYRKVDLVFGGNSFTMIAAYNGKTAWLEMRGEVSDQPALDYESDAAHTIMLLIRKDATFQFGKETELDGKKVIGVTAESHGTKTTFYFDTESGLPVEIAFQDYYFGQGNTRELMDKKVRYADYREFGGVLFPARVTYYEKGQKSYEFLFEKVDFNASTPDSLFERPDEKLDLRYPEETME